MNPLEAVFAAIDVFNKVAPAFGKLVAAVRHPDGTITVIESLDKADAVFAANEQAANDWLESHPENT